MKKNAVEVGDLIRKARLAKGFKQIHMAEALGLTQPAYSKIEEGLVNITLLRAFQLRNLLDIDHEDLVNMEDYRMPDKSDPANEGERLGYFTLRKKTWVIELLAQYPSYFFWLEDLAWLMRTIIRAWEKRRKTELDNKP